MTNTSYIVDQYITDQINLEFLDAYVSELLQEPAETEDTIEHPRRAYTRRRNSLRSNVLLIRVWQTMTDQEKSEVLSDIRFTFRQKLGSMIQTTVKNTLMRDYM